MKRLLIIPIAVLFFMVGCEGVGHKQEQLESLQDQINRLERTVQSIEMIDMTRTTVDVDKIEKVQDMILDKIGYSVVKVPYESEHYILVPSKSDECKEGCE